MWVILASHHHQTLLCTIGQCLRQFHVPGAGAGGSLVILKMLCRKFMVDTAAALADTRLGSVACRASTWHLATAYRRVGTLAPRPRGPLREAVRCLAARGAAGKPVHGAPRTAAPTAATDRAPRGFPGWSPGRQLGSLGAGKDSGRLRETGRCVAVTAPRGPRGPPTRRSRLQTAAHSLRRCARAALVCTPCGKAGQAGRV